MAWGFGRNVLGLDAMAAQTLGSLWGSLRGASVELVLTGVRRASMLRLLQVSSRQILQWQCELHLPSWNTSRN